jgi:hypothetical protein
VKRFGIPLAVAAVAALGVGAAQAAPTVQETLRSDGSGLMIANGSSNPPTQTWSWELCAADLTACTPFGTGQMIETGNAPADSAFTATSNLGALAHSRIWHGTVSSVGPPSLSGAVRANELVTPVPGQWQGGWTGDYDLTQLAACATPAGEGCITLTDTHYPPRCPKGAAVLDPAFTGRYLRVANRRYGAESVFPAIAVPTPYRGEAWPQDAITSVAVVGRVARATRARRINCGAPPVNRAEIGKEGIALVHCELGCRVGVLARGSDGKARLSRKLRPTRPYPLRRGGGVELRLPAKRLAALGPGRVRITVRINGARMARRTVSLP